MTWRRSAAGAERREDGVGVAGTQDGRRRPGPRRPPDLHDALGRGEGRLLQRDEDLLGGLEPLLRGLLDAPPDDRSSAGETFRPDAESSAGASFRIAAMVSAGVSFLKAFRPDSSS